MVGMPPVRGARHGNPYAAASQKDQPESLGASRQNHQVRLEEQALESRRAVGRTLVDKADDLHAIRDRKARRRVAADNRQPRRHAAAAQLGGGLDGDRGALAFPVHPGKEKAAFGAFPRLSIAASTSSSRGSVCTLAPNGTSRGLWPGRRRDI